MACKGCFEAVINECENIIIKANLPANYPLYWIVKKSGATNMYQRLVQTNGSGDVVIPKADLPDGFLIKGKTLEITLKNGNDYLQPVVFVFGTNQYSCVMAHLHSIDRLENDNSGVNVIQFKEAIVPEQPSGNSAIVVPFSNTTTVSYTHNLNRIVGVDIYDLAGRPLEGSIDVSNPNVLIVTFTSNTSGRVLIQ